MKLIPYLLLLTTALFTSCAENEFAIQLACDNESTVIPPCVACEECPNVPIKLITAARVVNVSAVVDTISRMSDDSKSWDQSVYYVNSKQDRRFFLAINTEKLPDSFKLDEGGGYGRGYDANIYPKYPWNQGKDGVDYCYDFPDTTICVYPFLKCHPFQDYVSKLNLKDSDVGKTIVINGYVYMYYFPDYAGFYQMKENPSNPCDVITTGFFPNLPVPLISYFVPCIPKSD